MFRIPEKQGMEKLREKTDGKVCGNEKLRMRESLSYELNDEKEKMVQYLRC